jgi:centromere/kinetochore protein ZW10
LASSIVRQAEAEDETEESLQEKEKYVDFLTKEVSFNDQLLRALKGIQGVNEILRQAENLAEKNSIVEALFKLEGSIALSILQRTIVTVIAAWSAITDLPLEKTTRAVRLLDSKCFDQRSHIYEQFTHVWNKLVHVDPDQRIITINKELPGSFPYWYSY